MTRERGRHTDPTRSVRKPRGVTMLFLLVTLPFIFIFAALAVDITRIVEAHRSLQQAADEAALSGAMSYDLRAAEPTIAPIEAHVEARKNWDLGVARGVITGRDPRIELINVSPREVTVDVSAEVDHLTLLAFFNVGDGAFRVHAQGRARVCLAGFEGDVACTRPDVR